MNFFQRAIKNVSRGLTKTVLLTITFFMIGNFVIVGLGVSMASENAKTLTRQKMRAVVTYTLDYDAIYEYGDSLDEEEQSAFYKDYPRITLDDVNELLKDERVKTANATNITMVYDTGDGLDYVHLNNRAEEDIDSNGQSCWIDENGNESCQTYIEPKFAIKANWFDDMIEFVDGDYTLVDGRFYTKEEIENKAHVVLLTKELAEQNGLKVGDDISVDVVGQNYYEIELDGVINLEIIGIYEPSVKITPDMSNFDYTYPYENPANMLLMPASTYYSYEIRISQAYFDYYAQKSPDDEYYSNPDNRPKDDDSSYYISDVTLLLTDPLDVDQFIEDYEGNLSQFKKLDANNDEFKKLAKPLDTLSLYSNFIVWLVVINAIVIITLVTALTLKTREYEIGVLLSVGASKMKIIAQFFVELALVAVLGFTLAVGSGSLIAGKVGEKVLEYQIANTDFGSDDDYYYADYYSIWDTDYTSDVSLEDLVAEYDVTVSLPIILEIYVVGLAIVLISVIIPSFMIMRFNPKRILMNQN